MLNEAARRKSRQSEAVWVSAVFLDCKLISFRSYVASELSRIRHLMRHGDSERLMAGGSAP